MTPEQRRLQAKIAADVRWSRHMAREDQVAAARAAMMKCLEREVDPDGKLPPEERAVLTKAAGRRLSAKLNAARKNRLLRDEAAGPGEKNEG